jgi:hypothetical protein
MHAIASGEPAELLVRTRIERGRRLREVTADPFVGDIDDASLRVDRHDDTARLVRFGAACRGGTWTRDDAEDETGARHESDDEDRNPRPAHDGERRHLRGAGPLLTRRASPGHDALRLGVIELRDLGERGADELLVDRVATAAA